MSSWIGLSCRRPALAGRRLRQWRVHRAHRAALCTGDAARHRSVEEQLAFTASAMGTPGAIPAGRYEYSPPWPADAFDIAVLAPRDRLVPVPRAASPRWCAWCVPAAPSRPTCGTCSALASMEAMKVELRARRDTAAAAEASRRHDWMSSARCGPARASRTSRRPRLPSSGSSPTLPTSGLDR